MYGHDIAPTHDYFVTIAEKAIEAVNFSVIPGAAVVTTFPWLGHIMARLPGTALKRYGDHYRKVTYNLQNAPFNLVRRKMVRHAST